MQISPMGYNLHITKKENWSDDQSNDITIDQWIDL